jgi:hypothetical protein
MYAVVNPLGKLTQKAKIETTRLGSLDGMTVAELSNHKFGSELTFQVLEKALMKRFPNMKLVPHTAFGDMYGSSESDVIKALPGKLKEFEIDAVISGNGG